MTSIRRGARVWGARVWLGGRAGTGRLAGFALMALAVGMTGGVAFTPVPAHAQDSNVQEIRLRKLEAEVRALQRQVFPGGDGKYFPKDEAPKPAAPVEQQIGTPATSAVTDLLTRMDAVEAQIAHLTAQNEEFSNRLRQLETRTAPSAPTPDANGAGASAGADQGAGAPALGPASALAPVPVAAVRAAPAPAPVDGDLAAKSARAAKPVATRPSAERLAAVKAVIKPQTDDPGEDDYTYGFKLWEAKFYPEAEQQLKLFLDKYPRHTRVTYARNLLGRAYLDDGKPREAAPWFLKNYETDKTGARAADSLLYLAQSMAAIDDTNRACIALAEFADTYKTEATGRLKREYDSTRAQAKCS